MIAEPYRLCVFGLLVYGALANLLCELFDCGVWGKGGCDVGLSGPVVARSCWASPSFAL